MDEELRNQIEQLLEIIAEAPVEALSMRAWAPKQLWQAWGMTPCGCFGFHAQIHQLDAVLATIRSGLAYQHYNLLFTYPGQLPAKSQDTKLWMVGRLYEWLMEESDEPRRCEDDEDPEILIELGRACMALRAVRDQQPEPTENTNE